MESITHALSRDILYLIGYEITTKDEEWSGTEAIATLVAPALLSALFMNKYYGIEQKRLAIISAVMFFIPNLIPNLMLYTDKKYIPVGLLVSIVAYSIIYRFVK
jgi:hypothetical protein